MTESQKIFKKVESYIQKFGIDVGCGEAKISDNAIGIDSRNLPCVTICKKLKNLELFGDAQFDFVFSSHFLEHVNKPEDMLEEMLRIAKKGGFIILYLPNPKLYKENNPEHKILWTPKQFKKIISEYYVKDILFDDKSFDYSYLYVGKLTQ